IMGRNMFGPIRGPWPDESWRGWWGTNPPYHAPTFVLTHHARPPLEMEGGTVFHFVTDGIQAALERATAAAGRQGHRLAGGVATIRQYLQARLIDELHLAVSPRLLGSGEHLTAGLDLSALGYRCTNTVATTKGLHYTIAREGSPPRVLLTGDSTIRGPIASRTGCAMCSACCGNAGAMPAPRRRRADRFRPRFRRSRTRARTPLLFPPRGSATRRCCSSSDRST